MTISVNDLGTNTNTAAATCTLTAVTVPAASLIIVSIVEVTTTASPGTVSDGVNTYQLATSGQNNSSAAINSVYYAENATLSAGTITYTKNTSGNATSVSACYATGMALSGSLDSAVTATATGNSATAAVTSGTPAVRGELFFGHCGCGGVSNTISIDRADGWTTPPSHVSSAGNGNLGPATMINVAGVAATLSQTLTSNPWFTAIVGFKPAPLPPQPVAVFNLGSNSNGSGATLTLTGVTVPKNSLICVAVNDFSTSGGLGGSIGDGTANVYQAPTALAAFLNNSNSTGFARLFYCYDCAALSAATITYTKKVSGVVASLTAFYVTGIGAPGSGVDPLETSVSATAFGSSTAPSVTAAAAPTNAGDLMVAFAGFGGVNFNQDVLHGWGPPPFFETGQARHIAGGTIVATAASTFTYAPSLSASAGWAAGIAAFRASPIVFADRFFEPGKPKNPPQGFADFPGAFSSLAPVTRTVLFNEFFNAPARNALRPNWDQVPPPQTAAIVVTQSLFDRPVRKNEPPPWPQMPVPATPIVFAGYSFERFATPPRIKVAETWQSPFVAQPFVFVPQALFDSKLAQRQIQPWPQFSPPAASAPFVAGQLFDAAVRLKQTAHWNVLSVPQQRPAVVLASFIEPVVVRPRLTPEWWMSPMTSISAYGFGRRKPLFLASAGGFPASYWPDGS